MVLGTANLTVEMAVGSQHSAAVSEGISEQVGWVRPPTDIGGQAGQHSMRWLIGSDYTEWAHPYRIPAGGIALTQHNRRS
jgi:hypothetical protein